MSKTRQTLGLLLFALLACTGAWAQNNTNSPYTRYGLGQLADYGSANSRAMGGVAFALRDKFHINSANPASYSAVDSLTFIFDGGVTLQKDNVSNGTLKMNANNSSFDYITMQFRAARWAGISLGLLPYSNVGYQFGTTMTDEVNPDNANTVTYQGEGGLHRIYLGAGFKILKNLSVGANISYLWGQITRTTSESFASNSAILPFSRIVDVDIKSYLIDFGVQYTHQFSKKHQATVGVVFTPGHDLNNTSTITTQTGNSSLGYTMSTRDTVATFGVPSTLGFGVAYQYDGRLTVSADLLLQQWSKSSYMNNKDAYCNRTKIALGAEYFPNPMGRSYFSHVKYRMGAFYSNPYYKVQGVRGANEYGVTAGFGLPIPRTRSYVNLSGQFVRTEGKQANFLNENSFRLCVGVTFNERWFFKRKVD